MSDTPLTDQEVNLSAWLGSGPLVHAEFARKLERELDELKATLESHGPEGHNASNSQVFSIRTERDEALAQMCHLSGCLSNIAEDAEAWLNGENDLPSLEMIKAIRDYAREALA